MKKFKLAVLGDSSTQLISKQLVKKGVYFNLDIDVYESDYDQIDQEIRSPQSNLYQFHPDGIFIYFTTEKLQEIYHLTEIKDRNSFYKKILEKIGALIEVLKLKLPNSKIFISNFAEINDGVYGNSANKYPASILNNIRRINLGLMDHSQSDSNIFILDMALLQSIHGRNSLFDPRMFIQTSIVLVGDGVKNSIQRTTEYD